MFLFKFGLAWTAFSLLIFGICLSEGAWEGVLFLGLFLCIGFWMIGNGWKQIKKDRDTEKYGKLAYAKIIDISRTGSSVNGRPELQAQVLFVKNGMDYLYHEIIGFDQNKYRVGQYVRIKHHEDDVNIINVVNRDSIPRDVADELDSFARRQMSPEEIEREELREMYRNRNRYSEYENKSAKDTNKKWEHTDNNYDW